MLYGFRYASSFAPQPHVVPRYDYNSLMYRLDLATIKAALQGTRAPASQR